MGFFSHLMGKQQNIAKPASTPSEILSPVTGELMTLESTSDAAFSSRAMGDGIAVKPLDGHVVAPVSGTVEAIFPTAHALAIAADTNEAQVMVHIGIDTVEMGGAGFTARVAQGDHVEAGQPLVDIDLHAIECAGFDPTTFCVVCERASGSLIKERKPGPVAAGETVIWLSE